MNNFNADLLIKLNPNLNCSGLLTKNLKQKGLFLELVKVKVRNLYLSLEPVK